MKHKSIYRAVVIMAISLTALYAQSDSDFEILQNPDNTITITGYKGNVKNVVIPSTLYGLKVTSIGKRAFWRKGLTGVVLPNSIIRIENIAFANGEKDIIGGVGGYYDGPPNEFPKIVIPNSVSYIGENAFAIGKLTSVSFGSNVEYIGPAAFYNNKINEIAIPNSITTINNGAFASNEIGKIIFSTNVKVIKSEAFQNNKLTELVLHDSTRAIERSAFANNQLRSVVLPKGVTIGCGAFSKNELRSITIPTGASLNNEFSSYDGNRRLGVFDSNPINTLVIPESLITVGSTFIGLPLTRITMPANKDDKFLSDAGFEASFVNFYKNQNRAGKTYYKVGPIWTIDAALGEQMAAEQAAKEAEQKRVRDAQAAEAERIRKEELKKAPLTDSRDGKTYEVIKVGNQIWMKENLNYGGCPQWGGERYDCEKYGKLYSWDAAMKACPAGWHLPSDEEWTTLWNNVGGGKMGLGQSGTVGGRKLKEVGFTSYGGIKTHALALVGTWGYWWSSTEVDAKNVSKNAWSRNVLTTSSDDFWSRVKRNKNDLQSVRCIQD